MNGSERRSCPSMCIQKRYSTKYKETLALLSKVKSYNKKDEKEDLVKRTKVTKDGKSVVMKMKPVILNFYTCNLCSHWRSTSAKDFEEHVFKHMGQNHKTIEEKTEKLGQRQENCEKVTENLTLNTDYKQRFSHTELIIQAILQAPEMQITLSGICLHKSLIV